MSRPMMARPIIARPPVAWPIMARLTIARTPTAWPCSTRRKRGKPFNGSAKKPRSNKPRGSSWGVNFPSRTLPGSGGFSSTTFPSVSLLQQSLIFLLSSHWVRRFFIDLNLLVFPFVYCYLLQGFFPLINSLSSFLPSFPSLGWEVFHQRHDPFLRLISFSTRLGYSHWSSGFPPQSSNGLGGFLLDYTHTYTYKFDGAHV